MAGTILNGSWVRIFCESPVSDHGTGRTVKSLLEKGRDVVQAAEHDFELTLCPGHRRLELGGHHHVQAMWVLLSEGSEVAARQRIRIPLALDGVASATPARDDEIDLAFLLVTPETDTFRADLGEQGLKNKVFPKDPKIGGS